MEKNLDRFTREPTRLKDRFSFIVIPVIVRRRMELANDCIAATMPGFVYRCLSPNGDPAAPRDVVDPIELGEISREGAYILQ